MSFLGIFWNNQEIRMRGLIRLILVSALVFCSYWLASEICLSIPNDYVYYLSEELITFVLTIILFVFAFKFVDKRNLYNIGLLLNKQWFISFIHGSIIGFVVIAANFIILLGSGLIRLEYAFASDNSYNFLLEFFGRGIGFFAVAVSEELFVRGYLLINIAEGLTSKMFSQKNSIIAALFITSIIFGILHYFNLNATVVSSVNLIFIGLFFGYAYVKTGSLALPVGIHFAWNFTQAQIFGLNVSGFTPLVSIMKVKVNDNSLLTGGSFGPEGGLFILVSVVLGLFLVNLITKEKNVKQPKSYFNIKTSITKYPQTI